MFSSFLFEKLSHLKGFYATESEFIKHLLSGEVTVPITEIVKYVDEYTTTTLPSAHQIGKSVWLCLWSSRIVSEIHAVHFYEGKVKYDLVVFGENGEQTRIYNIDSVLVSSN